MTVSFLSKCKTLYDYAYMGMRLGVGWRSKWLLASMLILLKSLESERKSPTVYRVRIQIGRLEGTILIRSVDIFLVHEVLWRSPYILSNMAIEPIRCIVDLGAHIGLATLAFKARFPEAEIHCYEPDPDNFELLRHNTMDLPGVVLHREAVGVSRTEATLYIPYGRHSASSLRPLPGAKQVREVLCQVKPLDEILAEAGEKVDLVKFDIEGMEYDVFAKSRYVHQVHWIVGEIKSQPAEVERFLSVFSHHDKLIRWQTSKMAYLYMKKRY